MVDTLPKPDVAEKQTTIANLPIVKASEKLDRISMLIYGDPGVGKTVLSGSSNEVESMRPVLFIDCEGGTKPLRETQPDIEVVRVQTLYDKGGRTRKSAWDFLSDGIYEDLKLQPSRYKTLVVDSLTEVSNLAMQHVMEELIAEHPERDPDVPGQKEYLRTASKVRRWVRGMRDLHTNIIFTALVREDTDETTGKVVKIIPAFAGKKLSYEVPAWVDNVMFLYTKTIKDEDKKDVIVRKGLSQPSGKHFAKDRSTRLPQVLDNPTMAMIADLALDKEGK